MRKRKASNVQSSRTIQIELERKEKRFPVSWVERDGLWNINMILPTSPPPKWHFLFIFGAFHRNGITVLSSPTFPLYYLGQLSFRCGNFAVSCEGWIVIRCFFLCFVWLLLFFLRNNLKCWFSSLRNRAICLINYYLLSSLLSNL